MKRESERDTDGCGGVSRRKTRRKTDGLTWMWPSEIPHQYAVGRLPAPGPPRAHLPMEGGGAGWPGGATRPQRGVVAAGQRALCLAGFRF